MRPFPRHMMSGDSPQRSDAKSAPVRPKPVATSSQISKAPVSRHACCRSPYAAASAMCMPAAPCTRGSSTTATSFSPCSPTNSVATASARGSSYPGARITGKRNGSKRSVPKPPAPNESAPTVSPW